MINIKFIFFLISGTVVLILMSHGASAQRIPDKKKSDSSQVMTIYRQQIDSVDTKIINLLGEREKIVRKVGVYKAEHQVEPLQAARFQEIIDKSIKLGNEQGLSKEFIIKLLNAIHEESLKIEEDLQKK